MPSDRSDPAPHTATSAEGACVDVRVETLSELFDRFDPAPLRERSLAPEIADRVYSRVEVLPSDCPIVVRVHINGPAGADEDAVRDAFRRHFAHEVVRHQRLIARTVAIGWRMLFGALGVALLLVVVSQFIAEMSELRIVRTLANGMSIVIWVTMWRPVESLVYDWRPIKESLRLCDRLAHAEVELCADQSERAP